MIYLILTGTYLNILATAILPFPSIIEKYFTGKSKRKGYNYIRTLTGFLLGASYVNGVYLFAKDPLNPALIGIGLIYFMIAGFLIGRET